MIWFREAFLLFLTSSVTGDIQIYPQFGLPHIIADFSDMPALFGEIIPSKGISVSKLFDISKSTFDVASLNAEYL